jgi:hypothetical protein
MSDCDFIFKSDFLIETMCSIMSPLEIYKFRHINNTVYNAISLDNLYKKIIELVCARLEKIFGKNYQQFLDIMKRRNLEIYGPFINEVISLAVG